MTLYRRTYVKSQFDELEPLPSDSSDYVMARSLAEENERLRKLLLRISKVAHGRADAPEALRSIREALKEAHQ